MKLSVKWLAGLAVLVLAIVAVVGSTSATKAAAGKIYVANEWSKITNEPTPADPYTFSSTVYSTFEDDPLVQGSSGRIILPGANVVKIVMIDAELNPSVPTTVTGANITVIAGGTGDTIATGIPGDTATIELTGRTVGAANSPIAGTLADVVANTVVSVDGGTTNLIGNQLDIISFFEGSDAGDPWIKVEINVAANYLLNHITYDTSIVGTTEVTVASDLENSNVTFIASETGIGTGRYEGFIQLIENGVTKISGDGSTGALTGGTGAVDIFAGTGQLTLSFKDNANNTQETLLSLDSAPPTNTITAPASGSATQDDTPIFSGTVSESGSGLKIDEIKVKWDNTADANNSGPVVNVATGNNLASDVQELSISTSGAVDGDTAFSFSEDPSSPIPDFSGDKDHIVDWVIVSADLAGNLALSDADSGKSGIQLPTIQIDEVDPGFTDTAADHKTGLAWDGTKEVVARNSLRVGVTDDLTNIQTSDFTIKLDSGSTIVPTRVTVLNKLEDSDGDPFNIDDSDDATFDELLKPLGASAKAVLYFEVSNDFLSDDTPLASIQDTITDLAGNSETLGDREVSDGIAPSITITLSDGSGTGAVSLADEGPDKLTKDTIKITITSDESVPAGPVVKVYSAVSNVDDTPQVLAEGSNTWTATFTSEGDADGKRAIEITADDGKGNNGTLGSDDNEKAGTPVFTLDSSMAAPSLSVGGAAGVDPKTDQTRPSIIIDYKTVVTGPPAKGGEVSTVTLSKVQLDGTDITPDVIAASDGKRFFYIPPTDLTLGEHTLLIDDGDAIDAAGNESTKQELKVTIEERKTFDLDIFAGWNAISFPSDPVDPDVNSVFDNAGHDAVLGFDPSVDGQWLVSIRDSVSQLLEPATENGLTSVKSTQAYWVHSLNFEQVKALLVGEVLPASGSPPGIITIQTVLGFNAIAVIDTSRKLTTGASTALVRQVVGGGTTPVKVSDYLGKLTFGRVYRWDPEILSFVLLVDTDPVNTGDVLFVEVTGTPVPVFP